MYSVHSAFILQFPIISHYSQSSHMSLYSSLMYSSISIFLPYYIHHDNIRVCVHVHVYVLHGCATRPFDLPLHVYTGQHCTRKLWPLLQPVEQPTVWLINRTAVVHPCRTYIHVHPCMNALCQILCVSTYMYMCTCTVIACTCIYTNVYMYIYKYT